MLVKTILVAVALATAPVLAVSQNIGNDVSSGSWPDGTEVAWQCQKVSQGSVKFIFVTPEGKKYAGMFSCGTSI
jgi:hypothetical protein